MARLLNCIASFLILITISLPAPVAAADPDVTDAELARTLRKIGELQENQGRYTEALEQYQKALAILELTLGPNDATVARTLDDIAALLQKTNRYDAAEPLYKRALAIDESTSGPDHPAVAQSLTNLADLYQIEGRNNEALELYQRALAIRQSVLGPDDPASAKTLNNLAALYQNGGQVAQAEKLYAQALAINERSLGSEHPVVATTLNNLASFYQSQGRLADAEPLYKRALAIRQNTLGSLHPAVAQSLNNLAALLQSEGRYADAESTYRRSLAVYERTLGPDHIEVSWSLNNLASLYENEGRFAEAEAVRKQALTIRERTPGPGQRPVLRPPPTPGPPISDPQLVEFLFASTRQRVPATPANAVSYSGERGALSFGLASVRIPTKHNIGQIELASNWTLFGITLSSTTPNERDHMIIKQVASLSDDAFDRAAKGKGSKTALVFVHGFNTTFEDALYRNAQIAWDLQYNGLSVLFTWASRGKVTDYIYDKESAYLARDAFIALLEKLNRNYGIEQVNVLAHSMGNLIVVDALANYARTSNPIHVAHVVMAAPDVDRNQFLTLAPVAKTVVGGMTIYVSSADRALAASRRLAGDVPRAGDVPADGPIILPNVETIDVTAMGENIFGLNHSVFAASRDVMEDIAALLKLNLPSPRLIQIRPVPDPPAVARYWRYVR
jgi:esterase/lipase superfamily enzyme/Tfp pilus assembly protein PilF